MYRTLIVLLNCLSGVTKFAWLNHDIRSLNESIRGLTFARTFSSDAGLTNEKHIKNTSYGKVQYPSS